MKPILNRKTPLQSKKTVTNMMLLFERYIDDKIISINIDLNQIQTPNCLYRIDLNKNTVEKVYPDFDW